jgi:hypothetical protein
MPSIYKAFAARTTLPVPLRDVKEFVLNTGEATLIARYPVDIDELHLRGMLRVFRDRPPYAIEDRVIAQIAYFKGLDEASMRLVCTKEMLHLLDNHHATASTAAQVSQLIEEVTLPLEAVQSIPGLSDQTKLINALCVLVPAAAGNLLRDAHREGNISAENVAKLARIPEHFARAVLSEPFHVVQNEIVCAE